MCLSVKVTDFKFRKCLYSGKIKGKEVPGQDLRVPDFEAPRNSRQLSHEGGKVVTPTNRLPLLPQEVLLVLISVQDS